jgi:hypothetical protein
MRIEYNFALDNVETPVFSVETTEGPTKLFTLTTLVVNVLAERHQVDLIFHSPNQMDLPKKIDAFRQILQSAPHAPACQLLEGKSGSLGTSYYTWITLRPTGGGGRD